MNTQLKPVPNFNGLFLLPHWSVVMFDHNDKKKEKQKKQRKPTQQQQKKNQTSRVGFKNCAFNYIKDSAGRKGRHWPLYQFSWAYMSFLASQNANPESGEIKHLYIRIK